MAEAKPLADGADAVLTPEATNAVVASESVTWDAADPESLVVSSDASHPANQIASLCAQFYQLGWVTGTGGGMSVRRGPLIWFAPTGVQKEQMRATDMFVLEYARRVYLRRPASLRPSQCTPLFLAAFDRGAGACIHTHSQWAVLVTLLVERQALMTTTKEGAKAPSSSSSSSVGAHQTFEIERIEQIKGIPKGPGKGMLGYFERLVIPVIENTAHEEDLTDSLTAAIRAFPDSYAVLVRRHGVYVWGDTTAKAKTQCESLDYIFQLAVRMHELGLPWTSAA